MDAVPFTELLATLVAVSVTVVELAADAVKVVALVVEPDRAPPPLTVQLTPALVVSLLRVA